MQPIAPDAAGLVDGVMRAGHDEDLPQVAPGLDVPRFLQQIGAHAAGGLAEKLGDVQHAKGMGTQPAGKRAPGDVERHLRVDPGKQVEIGSRANGAISQSNPRAGRSCGS
jgi:hypothetical protein